MAIIDKQYKTKTLMNPMSSWEKTYDTITTRALNEVDFMTLMTLTEKEGYVWMHSFKGDDFYSYLKPTAFNPAEYVNEYQKSEVPYKIKEYNIKLLSNGYTTYGKKKLLTFIHKSHNPSPADFIACKKLIR